MNLSTIENIPVVSGGTILDWLTIDRIGIIVGIFLGVVALFFKWKGWRTAKDANELSELANKIANESLKESKEANRVSELALMPDVEFKYVLKELESDYKGTKYYNYIQKNIKKYGRKYHHLILSNIAGNGKAVGWVDAYNWELFDGTKDGFDYEKLPDGQILIHTNYIFPGQEKSPQIPALIAQNDIFEDAKWLLIRIKYSDMLGNKHCKCKQFIRKKEERGFVQDSQKARDNIFHVRLPECEDNRKKCQDCFFDEKLIARGRAK